VSQTFNIHMRRTYEERFAFTVEAASVEEALKKAYEEQEDVDFNWNNVEQSDRQVMFVEDMEGRELYSLDEADSETEAT
jgi:hypothetical protein